MFRLVRTVSYIVGYAALVTPKLKSVENQLKQIDNVYDRDDYGFKMPRKWAKGILRRAGVKVIVEGSLKDNHEGVLIVSNHEGNFDIPVMIHALEKPFGFVSKKEVEKIPFLSKWMKLMNCIYLDRTDRRSSIQMIKDGVSALKEGHSILIFPEGTRSKGKGMNAFKAGSFKLAKSANVPIIPVTIKGTSDIMEKYNSKKMVPGTVYVTIHPPIEPIIFQDHSLQEVADKVHDIIENDL